MLDFAFDKLGLHRVEAACLPHNAPSRGLLAKSGFREEGFAREYLRINGRWQDHVLFAILRDDARRRRGGDVGGGILRGETLQREEKKRRRGDGEPDRLAPTEPPDAVRETRAGTPREPLPRGAGDRDEPEGEHRVSLRVLVHRHGFQHAHNRREHAEVREFTQRERARGRLRRRRATLGRQRGELRRGPNRRQRRGGSRLNRGDTRFGGESLSRRQNLRTDDAPREKNRRGDAPGFELQRGVWIDGEDQDAHQRDALLY